MPYRSERFTWNDEPLGRVREVFWTDSLAKFIQHEIIGLAGEFDVGCSVSVDEHEDGWVTIVVKLKTPSAKHWEPNGFRDSIWVGLQKYWKVAEEVVSDSKWKWKARPNGSPMF